MKVLIIGSGGREHCIAWKISQSSLVDKLYCAPGNGGTSAISQNIDISASDIEGLLKFALEENIDLTVVGPEAPLVEGIVDRFESKGLKIFGPKKEAARLEDSKVFAKEIMKKYGIPTANFEVFDDPKKAKAYIKEKGTPLVVKADGLAAGKGVIVCEKQDEAFHAIDSIMVDKKFGKAGNRIIIEDCLKGEEVSFLIFTDSVTIMPLVSSQDYKRAFDEDKGFNTGGMGAYSPVPLIGENELSDIIKKVFIPVVEGLKKEGKIYKGILYGGIMMKDNVPYVLEFNVRFGDPETQVILPKLKSDLVDIMIKTIDNRLNEVKLEWDERFCVGVVLASGGYPESYEKGKEIRGLEKLENIEDVFIFHAGTKRETKNEGRGTKLVTNGGRVLNVVGLGSSIKEAQDKVYSVINNIEFESMFYRKDIGNKILKNK